MNRFENVADEVADRTTGGKLSHLIKAATSRQMSYGYSHPANLPDDGRLVAGYKPMMWFMALLLAAFVTGCGGGNGILASGAAKAITSFSLAWNTGTPGTATGTINETATPKTIVVPVPPGTNLTALVATFTTTGASVKVGTTVQQSGISANDFTTAKTYIVTAADGTTATYTVTVASWFVDPLGADDGSHGAATGAAAFKTIQYAISDSRVLAGDTVLVAAGTYTEVGQIVINKNLTVVGADKTATIIKPAQDTGDSSSADARGWFLVPAGITFNLGNVTLDGTGKLIYMGLYYWGNGTVNNCIISNIKYNESGPDYQGRGMIIKGNVNVSNSTFTEMGRIGVQYFGGGGTASGNTFTGKGAGNWLDYGFDIGNGAIVNVQNNTISNDTGVVGTDGSAAVLVSTYFGPGTTATIAGNTLTDNSMGIAVGVDTADTSAVVAHNNTISANAFGIVSTQPVVDATNNWWGSASGPYHATLNPSGTGNDVSDYVDFTPWLTVAP